MTRNWSSLYLEPLWDVGPADVYLGGGGEADVKLVGLGEILLELAKYPPDIVGDKGLGDTHGVQLVDAGHVGGDDLTAGLPLL